MRKGREFPVRLLLGAGLVLAVALAGCQAAPAPEDGEAVPDDDVVSDEPDELQPVALRLEWLMDHRHAPVLYADAQGWFEEAGLRLEIQDGSGSADAMKVLGTGDVDFAFLDAMVLVSGVAVGVPVKAVAIGAERNPTSVLSLAENPIRDVGELRGKRIGLPRGSNVVYAFEAMLVEQGMTLADVEPIDVGFGIEPLLLDQVDGTLAHTNNETISVIMEGLEPAEMVLADFGLDLYGVTLATNHNMIENHPDVVQSVVEIYLRALVAAIENPDEALEAVIERKAELTIEREEMGWEKLVTNVIQPEDWQIGWMDDEKWQAVIDLLHEHDLIEREVERGEVFTNSFLPED